MNQLKDFPRFEQGTILTVRMRGHSRTNGQEYFAPAIVLSQFEPGGELEIIIFDASSGTAYNHAFAPRDVSSRQNPATGETEMYEVQSNIGTVLFSPGQLEDAGLMIAELGRDVAELSKRLKYLEDLEAVNRVSRVVPHGATGEFVEPAGAPKAQMSGAKK